MKRVARTDKDKPIVRIPDVVRTTPVLVEPQLGIIALQIEHVRVAVRINNVQNVI